MTTTPTDEARGKGPATIIAELEKAPNQQRNSSKALFRYADALRLVGRRKEALAIYENLDLESVPAAKKWLVSLFRGQVLHDSGRFSEAESSFRGAVEQNPASTVPRVYLGAALAAQERFADALRVLDGARELAGDRDEVYLNMALNLRTLGRLEESEGYLRQALAITPSYELALEVLEDVRSAIDVRKRGFDPGT